MTGPMSSIVRRDALFDLRSGEGLGDGSLVAVSWMQGRGGGHSSHSAHTDICWDRELQFCRVQVSGQF